MYRTLSFLIVLCCCDGVRAAICPTGTIAITRNAAVELSPICTHQTLGVVSSENSPDLACSAGATVIRTSQDTATSLYREQYTTPSIHIKLGDTECFANLVAGTATDTIHIKHNNTTYHTSELKLCGVLDPDATTTKITPSINTINWSGQTGNTTVNGISHCGISTGSVGDSIFAVELSDTATENLYCWCRIMSPAVSQWAYATTFATSTNCDTNCVTNCATKFADNATFRTALFATISMGN
ncbi:MAG: hypothetical protein IJX89_00515 [Alphaproteobacteria bacterium]|nr:hypothetical protein [Alphaproteobacteria bacterium]